MAAKELGVHSKTIAGYHTDPEFKADLEKALEVQRSEILNRIPSFIQKSMDAMEDLLGKDTTPGVRVKAASTAFRAFSNWMVHKKEDKVEDMSEAQLLAEKKRILDEFEKLRKVAGARDVEHKNVE